MIWLNRKYIYESISHFIKLNISLKSFFSSKGKFLVHCWSNWKHFKLLALTLKPLWVDWLLHSDLSQLTLFDLGIFLYDWTSSSILTVDWNRSQPSEDLMKVYKRDPLLFIRGRLSFALNCCWNSYSLFIAFLHMLLTILAYFI